MQTSIVVPKEITKDLRLKLLYSDPVQLTISQELEKAKKKKRNMNKEELKQI